MNSQPPRKPDRSHRRPAALASAVGMASVVLLSGCQWTSPLVTQYRYDPTDGVTVTVPPVQLRNVLIVSGGSANGPGTLVAWGTNPSNRQVDVRFQSGQQQVTLRIPPQGEAALSTQPGKLTTLNTVNAPPGGMADLTVSTPSSGAIPAQVPVVYPFDGSPYRSLAPAGFTAPSEENARTPSTAEPSATPSVPSPPASVPSAPTATPPG